MLSLSGNATAQLPLTTVSILPSQLQVASPCGLSYISPYVQSSQRFDALQSPSHYVQQFVDNIASNVILTPNLDHLNRQSEQPSSSTIVSNSSKLINNINTNNKRKKKETSLPVDRVDLSSINTKLKETCTKQRNQKLPSKYIGFNILNLDDDDNDLTNNNDSADDNEKSDSWWC
ncbi:unnamed protein product [Didymodactylos carnosus]|uniref:Uncharacterized protein n=1 Tax=Didymodactylos carnosus TaxID=1234261 RepID=A0A815ZW49_9BILA|nr:unnamed protein product [Didymodactylos carnosus]CAF4459133.1 unnamed protein product [Didymodactylos carnosus]